MGFVNQTYLQISLRPETKEFIKNKAEELGYKTVSAFLVSSAKNYIKVEIDTSKYREIAKEINYIGKNINSLVRRINRDSVYSDTDIEIITTNQQIIIDLMRKEYNRILKFNQKYARGDITLSEKKRLEQMLIEQSIPVPKKLLLEEIYEQIRSDFSYVIDVIVHSTSKDDLLDDYIYDYMEGEIILNFDDETLVNFSNELFKYTQRLKFKMANLSNEFDDDDWFALKDILDKYEEDV